MLQTQLLGVLVLAALVEVGLDQLLVA